MASIEARPSPQPSAELESTFQELARQWHEETAHLSSMTQAAMHPAYQRIIGMGPAALPLIFRELERTGGHWFWALRAITGEDPTEPEDAGKIRKLTDRWLAFARERGYL
jgi:hypothetical protein